MHLVGNFRATRLIALVTLLIVGSLASTVPPALAQALGVVSFSRVIVKGNQRIETATIRNFAAIKVGIEVTPGQINAARQRLTATGLFEDVAISVKGSSLVIAVREWPTINRIGFERNKRIKDDKLASLITSKPRHTYSPAQAEADVALIVDAYRQSGRQAAEVKAKIIRRSDNRVDLVFEIFEGKVVEIQRLSIIGNRNFSDRRLRKVLSTKQAGILRRFIKSDTFIADRLDFDKQVLRDYYLSRGFIDFEVVSATADIVRERNGFFVTFKVREGQSYKFGKITATSALKEIDPDAYSAVIKVKKGGVYSPNMVERSIGRMEDLASKNGLNFIRVNPRVTRNDAKRTLDIEFVIDRGPRVFVERIDIEGNTTTLDRVIRRQFETVEGDPFNPRQIRIAANRIKALGFFSKTDINSREGSSPDRVIVDVNVKEQPTGSLNFGVSYGASSGLGGTISLSESNFLGRGQFIKVDLGGGLSTNTTELTFAEPRLLGRNVRLELSAFRRATTQQNTFYDTATSGISPNISFPVSQNGRVRLVYRNTTDTVSNVTGTPSILIAASSQKVSSLGATYTYDTRSSGLNLKAGTIVRLSQQVAGLGGTAKYSKTTALVGVRTSMFNDQVTLSAEFEGGLLVSRGGGSAITDRFFLGGDIMRGYKVNGIGPRDRNVPNQDALGGNKFAVARFEANFPIGLPEEYGVAGGVFFDVGSVWGLNNRDGGLIAADGFDLVDASMQLRSVVGVSLFWKTAVGPLRFNFTKVLSGPTYDQSEGFKLTIGARF
ncbi:MAG: outer membrane protein assembly factor BamA [Alphaproteobacteria bacterium]|nr:outer membrane protein assembly factor BamA [Alphaproteobacteria bacterium]